MGFKARRWRAEVCPSVGNAQWRLGPGAGEWGALPTQESNLRPSRKETKLQVNLASGEEANSSPRADLEDPAGKGRTPTGLGLETNKVPWPLIPVAGSASWPGKDPFSGFAAEDSIKRACCRVSRWRCERGDPRTQVRLHIGVLVFKPERRERRINKPRGKKPGGKRSPRQLLGKDQRP